MATLPTAPTQREHLHSLQFGEAHLPAAPVRQNAWISAHESTAKLNRAVRNAGPGKAMRDLPDGNPPSITQTRRPVLRLPMRTAYLGSRCAQCGLR